MSRNFDASHLTKRRGERAVAGTFLTRMGPPNNLQGSAPYLGIKESSIMNAVKTGGMTEYTRYPTCVGISPGCPCPELNASLTTVPVIPAIPGAVSGITFTVGSVIVSWSPPLEGEGPFTYQVTPYLNGVALTPVFTSALSYKFTGLDEWKPYTFTVCAMNSAGRGPIIPSSSYFLAPPDSLSSIMSGSVAAVNVVPALQYVINSALNVLLEYIAKNNLGPTRGSRFAYVWVASVVGAWNWVRSEVRVTGTHDSWNWGLKTATPLGDNDSVIWLCTVIDYIGPTFFGSSYKSIYNCPADTVERVKAAGQWSDWLSSWNTWYAYRQADGFVAATTTQPTGSANWDKTIVVDGVTVNTIAGFPQPQQWTRLTVQGKKQGYLTHTWDNVLSSCLIDASENAIQSSVAPLTGAQRDAEVGSVLTITGSLTDKQKVIAEFWAGGPGTVSPPLMFIWMWKEYMRGLPSISCPTIMFSLLDLAIHLFEGGRVTWRLKAAHMEARPIQEIRRRYTGSPVTSWNGVIDGAQWVPYQEANFVTPPFADFPSGHSHFSKAFALTMNKWFGSSITKNSCFYDGETLICPLFSSSSSGVYGDFVIPSGSSLIQPNVVPAVPTTLSFSTWDAMADEAGQSRLYGGIHCSTAHTASQTVATAVDSLINAAWNIQTT